jgi:hypothetical protein
MSPTAPSPIPSVTKPLGMNPRQVPMKNEEAGTSRPTIRSQALAR